MSEKELATIILMKVNSEPQISHIQILRQIKDGKPEVFDTCKTSLFSNSMVNFSNYIKELTTKYKIYIKENSTEKGLSYTQSALTKFVNLF